VTIQVLRPGLLTTVQDSGRFGLQSRGIGPGGAMDPLALRLANLLVGNEFFAAALELTLTGPALRFDADMLIAITGASLSPAIDGAPAPSGHAILARAGTTLTFGECTVGCRAYLAVAGGIDVPVVLGSRATHLRAHFGGVEGRALRAGDTLPVGLPSPDALRLVKRLGKTDRKWIADHAVFSREITGTTGLDAPVRLLPGADTDRMSIEGRRAILESTFRVSTRSDRMGYRLEGTRLEMAAAGELTSEAVTWGTVQLPPDGQPIILLADRQTTGGYPVIGHVAAVDLPVLAQRKPGDELRFAATTLAVAQQELLERERSIVIAAHALRASRIGG
jgi:antagonist of KipI